MLHTAERMHPAHLMASTFCPFSHLEETSILMVLSSAGIFLFQRAICFPHLRGEGWVQVEAGWQLPDHKKFAMKPGDLLVIHSTSSELFNQFFSVTTSKSNSTSQSNARITAASYWPAISESILSSFHPVPRHERNNQFPVALSI